MSRPVDQYQRSCSRKTDTPKTSNKEWTDEEVLNKSLEIFTFSDPLPDKKDGTWRLFYNNCNGLAINNTVETYIRQKQDKKTYNYIQDVHAPTKLDGMLRQLNLWDVDLVGLSEMCIAWEEQVPRRVVQQITKQYSKNACWTVASSELRLGGYLKPGGTGILSMGKGTGSIKERGSDPWGMGRWSFVLFGGEDKGHSLLLVTAYRTGRRSGPAGTRTAWTQQQVILSRQGRKEEAPNEACIRDLQKWIKQYRTDRMELIICLDANELWQEGAGIETFARSLNLMNINQELNIQPTHPNIANIQRSTTIDYCLCSRKVFETIEYAASTPYELEVFGDHRGFIIDINIKGLLRNVGNERVTQTRKLRMSNPKAVEKYLDEVHTKFSAQNVYNRSLQLMRRVNNGEIDARRLKQLYHNLDRDVHSICTKAEKCCRPEWAGKLD